MKRYQITIEGPAKKMAFVRRLLSSLRGFKISKPVEVEEVPPPFSHLPVCAADEDGGEPTTADPVTDPRVCAWG